MLSATSLSKTNQFFLKYSDLVVDTFLKSPDVVILLSFMVEQTGALNRNHQSWLVDHKPANQTCLCTSDLTLKIKKNWDTQKIAVIVLKFELCGFTFNCNASEGCRWNGTHCRP